MCRGTHSTRPSLHRSWRRGECRTDYLTSEEFQNRSGGWDSKFTSEVELQSRPRVYCGYKIESDNLIVDKEGTLIVPGEEMTNG